MYWSSCQWLSDDSQGTHCESRCRHARGERGAIVGDKQKGKDGGNGKKPKKNIKEGHRPHEERQREGLKKATV